MSSQEESCLGKTVLITGASGFVGGHCINECLQRGYTVRGTVRKLGAQHEYLKELKGSERLSLVEADLTEDKGWEEAARGVDYVIHVAHPMRSTVVKDAKTGEVLNAKRGDDYYVQPALAGMRRILDACLKAATVKRLVLTSSVAAMGWYNHSPKHAPGNCMWTTAEHWTPVGNGAAEVSPYAKSKTLVEKMAHDYCANDKVPFDCISLALGLVVGPWFGNRVPDSVQKMFVDFMSGVRPPICLPMQEAVTDVRDIAIAHTNALTRGKSAGRYLIAGECLWLEDMWRLIRAKFGDRVMVPTFMAPRALINFMSLFDANIRIIVKPKVGSRRFIDNTPSQRELDVCYRPSQQTLADAIERALADDSWKPGVDWLRPAATTLYWAFVFLIVFCLYRGGVLSAMTDTITSSFRLVF